MFWQKKNEAQNTSTNIVNSREYEELAKRISLAAADIAILKAKVDANETDIANLRGKFNARLKGLKEEEQKEEKKENETINNGEFVGFG